MELIEKGWVVCQVICVCWVFEPEHTWTWLLSVFPHTHTLLFSDTQNHIFTLPEDNSCAVRWDCKRKSIYPSGVVLMTLPAGSLLLSFSLRDNTGSFCVGWTDSRVGWWWGFAGLAAGGLLSHHTQLFQDTGCTFDMCLLTLPMMPPLLRLSPG